MLRLALLTARKRPGSFAGALLAFAMSAVLVMAGGMLLESALRNQAPVTRYAAADAIVTGHQDVGPDHDVILGEPVRISSALVRRLAAVPGVRAAIATLGGAPFKCAISAQPNEHPDAADHRHPYTSAGRGVRPPRHPDCAFAGFAGLQAAGVDEDEGVDPSGIGIPGINRVVLVDHLVAGIGDA